MALSSKLLINSTHKTKTWWTFVSVLVLVFIPFLVLWLLCGEINLLENNWLIARNASVWHGMVTVDKIPELVAKYGQFRPNLDTMLQDWLIQHPNQQASIDCAFTVFNPIMLAPLLGLLAWSVAYPIIFNGFKLSGLDVLPFSTGVGFICFITIISGLIPQWGQNLLSIYWIVRILISFVGGIIVFFISNRIINKWLSTRDYGFDLVFGFKEIDRQTANTKQQLKENVKIFKDNKEQDKSYVEVEEGQ